MNKIILASASPRRRELLQQLGLEFEIRPSEAQEKTKSKEPSQIVTELSEIKAQDIYERLSEEERASSMVIGADTVVALNDRIMGKPKDYKEAVQMLLSLQGNTHQVYTGVTLLLRKGPGKVPSKISFYEKTDVTMYPASREEIEAYVSTGEPMDKAGAYGIQGRGAAFIKEIHGDYNNVVGLPIGRLYQEMKRYQC
ncbi:MAG: Maf family protein [Firmicutes bacterium]|nr:Maf family protein [Bacillota bacterium]